MVVSQRGIDFIKSKEGLRLKAYSLNDGKFTIGYGNTFYEDGSPVRYGDSITQARAESLFLAVLAKFERDLVDLITASLTQNQWDALLSYAYNRGIGSFSGTKLRTMVNANPDDPRIADQFVIEWGSNTTYKAALRDRRKQEAELYFSGSTGISNNMLLAGIGILFLIIIINQDDEQEQY